MIKHISSCAAMLSIFALAFAALLLTGCSSYQDHFDCPPGQGVGCKSVSQIDNLVEQGRLGQPEEDEEGEKIVRNPARGNPMWSNPLQVWLAPYQDRFGNFHRERVVMLNLEGD